MDEQLARAETTRYRPGDPGWPDFEAAHDALAQAERLFQSGGRHSPALLLYRSALRLLIGAHLARTGSHQGRELEERYWTQLVDMPAGTSIVAALSSQEQRLVASALAWDGETLLARLSADDGLEALRALRKIARKVDGSLEQDANGVRRVMRKRGVRTGLVALVLVIGAWVWDSKANNKPNLALHRPVTVSGQHPTHKRNPAQLVDGDKTNLGFHGDGKPNSNVVVDLGAVHELARIVVHNRSDCCRERAVPMAVEVSADGKAYQRISERKEPFGTLEVPVPNIPARYVRLMQLRLDSFHLSEVEVY